MAVKTPVRIGLIGCGGNQRGAHVPRLMRCVERGEAVIVAGCDPVAENLAAVVEKVPKLKTYTDHEAMLAAEQLDAVSISTPHTLHHRHILDSFAAGCHVLTEKPMVCTVAEAREVLAKRDETGLQLQVAYQRHFTGGYRWARELIAGGQAGQVRFVSAWQCQAWRKGQMRKGDSWRIKAHLGGGGQLNDSGSHLIDIVLWVTGVQPAAVNAVMDNRELEVDVLSAVSVACDHDAILNFSVVGDSVRQFDEEVVIWCDEATIQIVGGAADPVRVTYAADPAKVVEIPAAERPSAGDPDANFIDAVRGRATVEVPGECGLKVIQLSEAAWESARTGRRVAVAR